MNPHVRNFGPVLIKNVSVTIHDAIVKLYFAVGRHGGVFENRLDFLIHVGKGFHQGGRVDFSFLRLENVLLWYQSHASCLDHGVSPTVRVPSVISLFKYFGYEAEGKGSQGR